MVSPGVVATSAVKVAWAEALAVAAITQSATPVQAPVQPVKVLPAAAVATSLTDVPFVMGAEQVGVQATVPVPVPATEVVIWTVSGGIRSNLAETAVSSASLTVQAAVPVQAPVQPVNW